MLGARVAVAHLGTARKALLGSEELPPDELYLLKLKAKYKQLSKEQWYCRVKYRGLAEQYEKLCAAYQQQGNELEQLEDDFQRQGNDFAQFKEAYAAEVEGVPVVLKSPPNPAKRQRSQL